MNGKQREDLDWTAFRYVAAELSPAESRQFEDRLEQDQEAREAVGRVVEVTCAVRSLDWDTARPVTRVRRLRPWYGRRGVQVAVGLALGLMVALLVWGPRSGEQRGTREDHFATASPPAELAVVWSQAHTELNTRQDDAAGGWRWSGLGDRETDVPSSTDEEAAPDTPDWMIAGVVAMESEKEGQQAPGLKVEGI